MNSILLLVASGVTPVGVVFTIILAAVFFAVFYVMFFLPMTPEADAEKVAVAKFSDIPREPFKEVVSQFYLLQNGEPSGPYSVNEIRSLHAAGKLPADTQLARGGEDSWMDLQDWMRSITRPVPAVPAPGTYLPAEGTKTVGAGLVRAGLIIGALGLIGAICGVSLIGPLGIAFGASAIGLGLVLVIIGACIK